MNYYRAIQFKSSGPLQEREIIDRLEAIPGVTMLSWIQRKLGWLERTRLLFDEYVCQMVLVIADRPETTTDPRRRSTGQSPYRTPDDELVIQDVSPTLAELLDALDATHSPVKRAILFFESRVYEHETITALAAEVTRASQRLAVPVRLSTVESSRVMKTHKLVGRAQGLIQPVHQLRAALIDSMRVGADAIKVRYA